MDTIKRFFLLLFILSLSLLSNAQKTMKNYLESADPSARDSAVIIGTPIYTTYPYVIAVDDDIVPYNGDTPVPAEMSFGNMPYSIETTPAGQVHLNIPINNYADKNEFAPEISLDYNSGRNSFDVLGKGWTVKGLPVITRVPKDYFTNGNVEGISLTDNYTFSLNGERLINQLEESVDTIFFVGQTSNIKAMFIENDRFIVLYPDGRVATFINTDGINYCVTRMTQKDGQEITYNYSDPYGCGSGHQYIGSIHYGTKRIEFIYSQTNDDRIDYYTAGKQFKLRTKLNHIKVYEGSNLITRFQLLSGNKTDSPLQEIKQLFDGGKHFSPMRLNYINQNFPNNSYSENVIQLSRMFYNINPEEYVLQRGNFSHYSGGEGFLMFNNKDSYYYDTNSGKVLNDYNRNDSILVACNTSPFINYVPSSLLPMEDGFVDAFTINADSIPGEEIIKINNWISDNGPEQISMKVYSADDYVPDLKRCFNLQGCNVNGSNSIIPKTFLTGDFDGDGLNELIMVEHYSDSTIPTPFKMVNLCNGLTKMQGSFEEHIKALFPHKTGSYPYLDAFMRWIFYKNSDKLFTIDYNGDGKQEIGIVDSLGLKIYDFIKNYSGNVSVRKVCSKSFPSLSDLHDYAMKIGEFNGDGMADILFYLETDSVGSQTQKKLFKTYLGKGDGTFVLKDSMNVQGNYMYYPHDVMLQANKNSMTDIVVSTKYQSGKTDLTVFNMRTGTLNPQGCYHLCDSTAFVPAFFYGECSDGGILTVNGRGEIRKLQRLRPVDETWKLSQITDVNRNFYQIRYRRMYESDGYHPAFNKYNFPFTTYAEGQLACHRIQKYDSQNNLIVDKLFDYGNAVCHRQGLGFLGYDNVSSYDSIACRNTSSSYSPLHLGAPLRKEDYKSVELYTHALTITPDRHIKLLLTGMSHFDKATNRSDTTDFSYDQLGNVTQSHTLYQGGQEKAVYSQYLIPEDNVNITSLPTKVTSIVTNSNSSVVSGNIYLYDDNYLKTSEKSFFGNENQVLTEKQLVYDSSNRVVAERLRRFNSSWLTSTYTYNGNKRKPANVINECGVSYDLSYDKFGIVSVQDMSAPPEITPAIPSGGLPADGMNGGGQGIIPDPQPTVIPLATSYERDEAGNMTYVTNPDGTTHKTHRSWIYNNTGKIESFFVTDSITGKPVIRTYYNSLGQKTRVETQRPDSSFLKVDYEYDAMGRLIKQYEPYKTDKTLFTLFEYDAFDRLVSKTYPDGHSDTYTYNGLTTASNVEGITSSRTVDDLGNLVSITDPGGTIAYSMTADGRPLSINVNGEASTTFEYDIYGRKTALNDPSAGRTSYTYDNAGNIATVADARGNITSTTYNDIGKPVSSTIGSDMSVTYSYNSYMQPISVTCSNGNSKQFTYNKYHQLTSETINGFKKSYNYSGGNVASIGYSLNNASLGTEQYVRTRGTLTAINYEGKTLWRLDGEDDHAMPTAVSSSVVSTSLEYDDMHRVTGRIAATGTSGTIHDMQYEYDTYGNMTGREDGIRDIAEDFGYDNLGRLVSAPDGDITYDGKGNITLHDAAGVYGYDPARPYALEQITLTASGFPTSEQTVSYNSMNRPDTISERGTVACLEYFEDGERSQMTLAGRGLNCTYRYFGNQFTVIDNNLTGSQKETQMLFIGGDAYNAPAAFVREKAFNSNKWIKSMYFIVRDNLGSITHVVDSTGAVVQELSYDAWGRLRDPETQQVYAPGNQPDLLLGRGYCGHEHMPAFNLLNMNARLYDPWTARFLSPDPYVQLPDFTQSLNRYSYCLNNPLKYYDYNGKKFDYSGLSSQEYVSYMSNIQILLNNSLFRFIYDKLKSSTNTYHVKFDHNGDYIDNPDLSDAIYLDSENTLYLGGSCTSWTISEELYHAFQDDNNLSNAPYNLELEANFAALLMTNGIGGTTYKSFENRIVDYACYKYGDSSKNELITYDKIDVIIRDYLEIGQTFIYDRPEFKKYTIPVDSFPSLLFNLLTTVYN